MAKVNQAPEKNPLVPQDWGVWAEINYLDSATEYREYVPTAPIQNPLTRGVFVACTSKFSSRGRRWSLPVITFLVVALIAGYCVYAFMNLP
jgi:hypothetical protein